MFMKAIEYYQLFQIRLINVENIYVYSLQINGVFCNITLM